MTTVVIKVKRLEARILDRDVVYCRNEHELADMKRRKLYKALIRSAWPIESVQDTYNRCTIFRQVRPVAVIQRIVCHRKRNDGTNAKKLATN